MARYCSAQDNVRTRQYRETIRVNVLHGRKSMSWAKSVLPLFTGTSSETFRKVPDRVQIDTTLNRQNCIQNHAIKGRCLGLNRTEWFGVLNSRLGAHKFPFGRQQELAVKASIYLAIFGAEPALFE